MLLNKPRDTILLATDKRGYNTLYRTTDDDEQTPIDDMMNCHNTPSHRLLTFCIHVDQLIKFKLIFKWPHSESFDRFDPAFICKLKELLKGRFVKEGPILHSVVVISVEHCARTDTILPMGDHHSLYHLAAQLMRLQVSV